MNGDESSAMTPRQRNHETIRSAIGESGLMPMNCTIGGQLCGRTVKLTWEIREDGRHPSYGELNVKVKAISSAFTGSERPQARMWLDSPGLFRELHWHWDDESKGEGHWIAPNLLGKQKIFIILIEP